MLGAVEDEARRLVDRQRPVGRCQAFAFAEDLAAFDAGMHELDHVFIVARDGGFASFA